MAAVADEVIFECPLLKLRGTRKKAVKLGGSNSWQSKYFMLKKQGSIPYLEYYNKKPKNKNTIPRGKIPLRPSFRVEKSMNAKNRAYVFEVVTPARHLCLSADEQKVMDLFVFYLQIQVKLSTDVIDDYFIVDPENSEAHRRIGARGAHCIFHVAPWGVTLALQNSRAVLAQWPLKCIRCYESNSNGQFILEAGRIAPMGDGVYVFNTRPGVCNAMYDLLDKYVLAATAALKGRHPNNQEQFHDLQLERDRLNALTTVSTDASQCSELSQITLQNYNHRAQDFTEATAGLELVPDFVRTPPGDNLDSLGYLNPRAAPTNSPHQALQLTNEMFGVSHSPDTNRNILAERPPVPTPSKSKLRTEKSMEASGDLDGADGYFDMRQSTDSLDMVLNRTVSVPPMSPSNSDWIRPPSFGEATRVSGGSYAGLKAGSVVAGSPPQLKSSGLHLGPVLPEEDKSFLNPRALEEDPENPSTKKKTKPPVAPRGKNKDGESPATTPRPRYRMMRLKSHSCEDVSDFQKSVYENAVIDAIAVDDTASDRRMAADGGKHTPEPFSDLNPFENKLYATEPRSGRRFVKNDRHTGVYDSSQLPMAHLPQYYNHNNNNKPNLGRSVSNPNFFDLETKDIVTKRDKAFKPGSYGTPSLGKSTTRSLASLLPGALKRHLSRENNANNNDNDGLLEGGHRPRSRSNSFRVRSNSMTKSSSDLPSSSGFVRHFRRSSFGSKDSVSASTKGITMSEKSRSFRKHKSMDSNLNRQTSEVSANSSLGPPDTDADSRLASPGSKSRSPIANSRSPPLPAKSKPPNTKPRLPGIGSQSPVVGSRSPGTPSRSPDTPSRSPVTPSGSPGTPSRSPGTPSRSPGTPSRSPGTPSRSPGPISANMNGHSVTEYDTHSLPVRKKNPSIMAGRRLPSLPDEKKSETAC